MWLGSILPARTSPCLFILGIQYEQLGMFVFILFGSAFCWKQRFSDISHSNIVFLKAQPRSYKDTSDWMQREAVCIWCIHGDQSTRELILHQVSSISSGSGSLGRCSLDTMKTVCTSRPREGLCGRKRLRSPHASRLQTKCQDKDSNICNTEHH